LPVALMMEWLAHAALHANPGLRMQGLDGFSLFKGVVFNGDVRRLRFYAAPASRSGDVFDVAVELRGVAADGAEVLHARAMAVLSATGGADRGAPTYELPQLSLDASSALTGEEIYARHLFHGEAMHAIERVDGIGPTGLVAAVRACPSPESWMRHPLRSDWVTNPLGIDAAFQAAIVWCREKLDAPSLPTAFDSYRQYRDWAGEPVTLSIDVTRSDRNRMVCDVRFIAADGAVVAMIGGYACTVDRGLSRAFERRRLSTTAG